MRRLIGAAALCLLAASCSPLLDGADARLPEGRVTLVLGGADGRTVLPNFPALVNEVTVTMTPQSGGGALVRTAPSLAGSVIFDGLPTGEWTLRVEARSSGSLVGSGEAPVTVNAGVSQTVRVPIIFDASGSAKGSLKLELRWHASLEIDHLEWSIDGGVPYAADLIEAGGYWTTTLERIGLDAGGYRLDLHFKRGGAGGTSAGKFVEGVNIFPGRVSDAWMDRTGAYRSVWELPASDFLDSESALYDLTINGASIGFASGTAEYHLGSGFVDSIYFRPSSAAAGQYITYIWNEGPETELRPGTDSPALPLRHLNNKLFVTVRAPDRATTRSYSLDFEAYELSFNGNGSTGGTKPASLLASPSTVITVPGNPGNLTKPGYAFQGWNTADDGTGTAYLEGASLTMADVNRELFAQWTNESLVAALATLESGGTAVITGPLGDEEFALIKTKLQANPNAASVTVNLSGVTNTTMPSQAFYNCSALAAVILPTGLTALPSGAFWGCTGITNLTLPDSVTSLGAQCFQGANSLAYLHIGTGLSTISNFSTFNLMPALLQITVAPGNTNFVILDGVLYNTARTILYRYPPKRAGDSFTIPSTVTRIYSYAFGDCLDLTTITVPASVATLDSYAFDDYNARTIFHGIDPSTVSIQTYTFGYTHPNLIIQVPADFLAAYQAAWPAFSAYMTE